MGTETERPLTFERAREILVAGAGEQFDPEVVVAFAALDDGELARIQESIF